MMSQQQQPGTITVQADQKISVTLQAGIWSQIITVIQEAPISWVRAQPLVQALGEQLQAAAAGQGPLPNGHDTAEHVTQ